MLFVAQRTYVATTIKLFQRFNKLVTYILNLLLK